MTLLFNILQQNHELLPPSTRVLDAYCTYKNLCSSIFFKPPTLTSRISTQNACSTCALTSPRLAEWQNMAGKLYIPSWASFLMAQWSRRLATICNHFWNQKIPGSTPGGEASFLLRLLDGKHRMYCSPVEWGRGLGIRIKSIKIIYH